MPSNRSALLVRRFMPAAFILASTLALAGSRPFDLDIGTLAVRRTQCVDSN